MPRTKGAPRVIPADPAWEAISTNPSLGLSGADAHARSGMPSSVRSSQMPLAASSAKR
jgi:hypothetical protein